MLYITVPDGRDPVVKKHEKIKIKIKTYVMST